MAWEIGLGDAAALLGIAGGSIAFSVGLWQYRVAQKWKRSEFAAKLLEQFNSDERLALCCKFLDYSARKLPVPQVYSVLAEDTNFVHNWEDLRIGMRPESETGVFTWQQVMYRDLFDYFFGYLERVEHYISIGLIDTKDVAYLRFWLKEIAQPRFVSEPVFLDFIQTYGYERVLALLERFDLRAKQ